MAVELIARPIGHKLSITQVTAVIVDDGTGDAIVYVAGGHSLSDGDYVYIESNVEAYNGFKYVDSTAYDYFKIKDSEGGDFIPYYQDQDITMYVSVLEHGWQSVHLPIAYELESDLWPENVAEQEYNPNVIDSFTSYGGNTKINTANALSDPVALTFIELVGDGPLAGAYQILTVLQDWEVVINLAYDAANDFSPYTVVKYYNNYHINVEVWTGLETDNRWFHVKPLELAGTLKLIPDSNGRVKFSIHDILRGYVKTRNNLTLNTLPNNTDFHTEFYIKYSEGYDTSDGVEITVFEGAQTTDSFIGNAVNSMMPFKSQGSGFMSDYINEGAFLARWLTLFDRPVAVVGYFFDVSFINQYNGVDIIILRNGELFQTIVNPGAGVIRVGFIPEEGFTEYCLQAYAGGENTSASLAGFVNVAGPDEDWVTGATPSISINFPVTGTSSDLLQDDYNFITGIEYTVTVFTSVSGSGTMTIRILDDSLNTIESESGSLIGGGDRSITFVATSETTKIGFTLFATNLDLTLSDLRITSAQAAITEQLCIDIIEECGSTFTNDNLRLTEPGEFRELES